jgi:hypothetical protein
MLTAGAELPGGDEATATDATAYPLTPRYALPLAAPPGQLQRVVSAPYIYNAPVSSTKY